MTRDEMIEKAARATWEDGVGFDWDKALEPLRAILRAHAEAALTAVIPGIMAGTHAELPLDDRSKWGMGS